MLRVAYLQFIIFVSFRDTFSVTRIAIYMLNRQHVDLLLLIRFPSVLLSPFFDEEHAKS